MDPCIFCQIAQGQLDAVQIWENEEFFAALDINPNVKGMTLVISKDHYDSDLCNMPDATYKNFFGAARQVSELLKTGLDVKRIAMVVEGMGINHAHIKLYPLYGLPETFQSIWCKERIYFEKYPGYITTQLGPQADIDELKKLARTLYPEYPQKG